MKTLAIALILATLTPRPSAAQTLREAAERAGAKVGAMIIDSHWQEPVQQALVAREFNAATVGIYWNNTRPSRDRFDWTPSDPAVDWARSQGMWIHLHPLVYAEDKQTPAWLLAEPPEHARELLEAHIRAAAEHFRGRVDAIDVVNECIAPNGRGLQDCWWLRSELGDKYVIEAFRSARKYAPGVHLILNENNCELDNPWGRRKWEIWLSLLTELHDAGLVDGAGWQLHTNPDDVLGPLFVLDARMAQVERLGLASHVTELDLPLADNSAKQLARQAEAARKIADVWTRHRHGGSFTTWGVSDRRSWLDDSRGPTRPLMFAANYAPKPFYFAVRDALLAAGGK